MTAVTLPADETAEQAVLGAVLLDGRVMAEVVDLLRPEDFVRQAHRRIYAACLELWRQGQEVDLVSVQAELERRRWMESVGGLAYLTKLVGSVPASSRARHYAGLVSRSARLRRIVLAAREAERAATAGDMEAALKAAGWILDAGVERGVQGEDIWQTAFETLEAIHDRRVSGVQEAVPTGLQDLDDRLDGGLWPSELAVVAARPGTGKTAFLLSVGLRVAARKQPVLLYSLEQSARHLALRAVAAEVRTSASALRRGWLSEQEWHVLFEAALERTEQPLHVVDRARLTVDQMLAYARVMQRQRGLSLVLVDYLQIIEEPRLPGQTRAEQVGEISRKLKAMAMELGVPVLAAAQLNRRADENQRPSLADLRESGAIEQDADVVLFLWRPGSEGPAEGPGRIRCTIAKQRNGSTGELDLMFLRHIQRFECVAREETA